MYIISVPVPTHNTIPAPGGDVKVPVVGIYAIIIMFSSILLYSGSLIDFVYSDFFSDLLLLIY